jgi:hypothetical protein
MRRNERGRVVQESPAAAIGARIGLHAHDCQKAWDWRRLVRKGLVGDNPF